MKIGIYDSGIGGMTVAKEIMEGIPNVKILYVADSKFFPYNNQPKEIIFNRTLVILDFFYKNDCDIVVIACNTASAIAVPEVYKIFPKMKIFSIIDMLVDALPEKLYDCEIALLGTLHTVDSGVYDQKLETKYGKIKLKKIPAPKLASLCENFICNPAVDNSVLYEYLDEIKLSKVDHVIIACTHYPIMIKEIKNFFQDSLNLVYRPNFKDIAALVKLNKEGNIDVLATKEACSVNVAAKILLNQNQTTIIDI